MGEQTEQLVLQRKERPTGEQHGDGISIARQPREARAPAAHELQIEGVWAQILIACQLKRLKE